ncbi:MAG: GMC family oxidoreductase [Myxococcales bacterium]|nr:GMC family oxidoreductase [Myxococcales bacterium]
MISEHADYARREEQRAEIVVIGTGAGGAVVGAELAEAGYDVLFLEEGGYHPTSSMNPYVQESIPRMYRDASATIIFGRAPISYVEGRCVGGSTTINGGMAYRAPEAILAEWARSMGQPDLGPASLEEHFLRVEAATNVGPQLNTSIGNDSRIMAQGAAKLGWEYVENPRNQDRCVGANSCVLGCPTGAKRSTLVSYMPRAIAAGARCLTEVKATKLIIEGGRCVGVEGRAINPRTRRQDKRVRIRAKAVVVACGAVQTPTLLLRHGLGRPSGQLGRNFTCHPNAKVLAVYPFEVRAWQGVNQAGQIREFHDQGILFAENFIPPGALAANMPLHGEEIHEAMLDYNRMVLTGVLVEDSTSGRIHRLPFGGALPRYDITAHDHARFLWGVRKLAELHFEMGASKVYLPFSNLHVAHHPDELARIAETQRSVQTIELFTPHLMGTARMGSRPSESVVDLRGEVWDLPGCFVADASLFPSAIGVNPQVTIMAMADQVAHRMGESRSLRRAA